jgi:cytochrome c biogenesis protein CcdA
MVFDHEDVDRSPVGGGSDRSIDMTFEDSTAHQDFLWWASKEHRVTRAVREWGPALMSRTLPARQHCHVLELAIIVGSLGIADSINPVTIFAAIYLASTNTPRTRLAGFVTGVFTVYLAGGLVLLVGPAGLLDGALGGVRMPGADFASLALGAVAIVAAWLLWMRRARLGQVRLPERALAPRSAFALGAVVTALDLPTAFPYFGAIAVVAASGAPLGGKVLLLVLFNTIYILPLGLVLAAHLAFGERCEAALSRAREAVERAAVPALAAITLVGGFLLVARGASGLIA